MRKSLAGVFLTLCLVLSMTCTAFAADVTINSTVEDHTYTAYQIFTGDLLQGGGNQDVMTGINWGNGVTSQGQTALYGKFGGADAGALAEKLKEAAEDAGRDVAREVADLLVRKDGYLANGVTDNFTDGKYQFTDLADGYYLITDRADSGVLSAYMVKVVGEDVPISPKVGAPTLVKKVEDINDSEDTPELSDPQDSADYDIGDAVPFTITITLPDNYDSYAGYYMAVTDTMSEGLELNEDSIKITLTDGTEVDKKAIDSSDAYAFSAGADGFKLAIKDLKDVDAGAKAGDTVVITYTATLTEDAVIGAGGNSNTAYLTYQRDPNFTGSILPGEYGETDEPDSDNDGTPDDADNNDDGDDIPDDADDDDDGDGIPDAEDDDVTDSDNDGTPDSEDDDDDGDNTPDSEDDDDDGDDIPDAEESDDVTGNTPKDEVVVYTFNLFIEKVDGEGHSLEGATFRLYKYNVNGSGISAQDETGKAAYAKYFLVEDITSEELDAVNFTFKGLDDGKYLLVETAPEGYNPIEPMEFEIVAGHTTLANPTITLEGLKITITSSAEEIEGNENNGQIDMDVVNYQGAVLPETGGMGTTIFYVIGCVLVLGAGVLLVTKRRVDKSK